MRRSFATALADVLGIAVNEFAVEKAADNATVVLTKMFPAFVELRFDDMLAFVTEDAVLLCRDGGLNLPFAGTFEGHLQIREFLEIYSAAIARPRLPQDVEIWRRGNKILFKGTDYSGLKDMSFSEVLFWHTVTFERSLITRCLLYTSPSPRDLSTSRMPSSA